MKTKRLFLFALSTLFLFSCISLIFASQKVSSFGEEILTYYEESNCDGLRIYGTGKQFDIVVANKTADINDKKSLIVEMTFGDAKGGFSPIVFDKYGNYYQAFGKGTSNTFSSYNAKTLEGLSTASETKIWQWGYLTGEGKTFFEVPFDAFCWRYQSSSNYYLEKGNVGTEDVDTLTTKQANNSAMGFAIINYTSDNTAFDYTLNAIYLRDNDNNISKVVDGTSLTVNENAVNSSKCDLTENVAFTCKIYSTSLNDSATLSIEKSLGSPISVAQYGLLNGVKIVNTDTSENHYTYFHFKGDNNDFNTENYVLRIANTSKMGATVSMFFYDTRKSNTYRSRVVNGKPFYLFDTDFNFVQEITPHNQWGWIRIPQEFNGYMVMPKTSFEWLSNACDYFTFVCQTPNALNIEVGESKFVGGLNANKTNLSSLYDNGTAFFTVTENPLSKIEIKEKASHTIEIVKNYNDNFEKGLIDGVNLGFSNGAYALFNEENIAGKYIAVELANDYYESVGLSFEVGGVTPESVAFIVGNEKILSTDNSSLTINSNTKGVAFVKAPNGDIDGLKILSNSGKLSLGKIVVTSYTPDMAISTNRVAGTVKLNPTEQSLADIVGKFTVSGITLSRCTTNNSLVSTSSLDYEFNGNFASINLINENALILEFKENYSQFTKSVIYDKENTFDFNLTPTFIKDKNYIFADKNETLEFSVNQDGSIIVFVTANEYQEYISNGFTELFYTESFIRGLSEVLICFEKEVTANETITIENAQLVIVGGEKQNLAEEIAPVMVYGDDIPEIYQEDEITFVCGPTVEITAGGRYFVEYVTGGTNEPQFENVLTVLVSDDGVNYSQYQIIDSLYDNMVRTFDGQLYYDKESGRLYHFMTQDRNNFYGTSMWVTYTDNPDAKNLSDIVWSTPKYVAPFIMCNNPTLLSNGKYAIAMEDPYGRSAGKTDCYVWIVDDLLFTNPVKYAIKTDLNSKPIAESQVVELADGTLWHISRTEGNGAYNEESFLYPNATEFTKAVKSDLICNGATSILVKLDSGNLMYVYCAESSRSKMTVALSQNEGKTWSKLIIDERIWVSMPDYSITPDGKIFIVYDHERASKAEIRYAIITEEDILAGDFVSEGSVKMGIIRKSANYKEIIKIFTKSLSDLTYIAGVTQSEILNSLPTDITVGTDDKKLQVLTGSWSLQNFVEGQTGEYTLVFNTTLPNNINDHYGVLNLTVKVVEEVQEPNQPTTPNEPEVPQDTQNKGCGGFVVGNIAVCSIATITAILLVRRKRYEE